LHSDFKNDTTRKNKFFGREENLLFNLTENINWWIWKWIK